MLGNIAKARPKMPGHPASMRAESPSEATTGRSAPIPTVDAFECRQVPIPEFWNATAVMAPFPPQWDMAICLMKSPKPTGRSKTRTVWKAHHSSTAHGTRTDSTTLLSDERSALGPVEVPANGRIEGRSSSLPAASLI